MRQKPQKSDKNQGGKQKTQWDSNSEGSAGEDRRWEGLGAFRVPQLQNIFTTERTRVLVVEGGLVWGEVHLHRSTGLRSWTAKDRRSGARGVSLLHPQLSLRECSSPHHSLSRKRKGKRKATKCTHSNQKVETESSNRTLKRQNLSCDIPLWRWVFESKPTMVCDQFEGEMKIKY